MTKMIISMSAMGLSGYNTTSTSRFSSKNYMQIANVLMGQSAEFRTELLTSLCEKHPEQGIILCRMLFEAKPGQDFRRPFIGEPQFIRGTKKDWPLEPITLIDEVPFLVTRGYILAGEAEPASEYLKYCLESCNWTSRRFEPVTTYWKVAKIRRLSVFQEVDVSQQFKDLEFFIYQTENFHAIKRGKLVELLGQSLANESVENQIGGHEGADCLIALAKLRAGGVLDAKWEQRIKDLAFLDYEQTYSLALQTILLCELDAKIYGAKISKNLERLFENQKRDGSWSYKSGPTASGDGSNTRFAIWALSTAEAHGFPIPRKVWLNAALYWLDSQNGDGGWGYAKSNNQSTATMTLSGIACLGMIKNSPNTPGDRRLDEIVSAISKAWERPGLSDEIAKHKKWRVYGLQVLALASEATLQQQSQSSNMQLLPISEFTKYFDSLKIPLAEVDQIDLGLSIIGMTPSPK